MAYMQHRQDPFMGSAEEMGEPMSSMGMPMIQPSYQPQQQAQQTLNQVAPMTMATMPPQAQYQPSGQPLGFGPQQQQLMRAAPMTMSTMQPMQPMPGPTAQPIGGPPGFAPTMSPAPMQGPGGGEGAGHQIVHAAHGGIIPQYGMGGLISLRGGGTVPMIYADGGYIPGHSLGGFFKGLGKFALKAAPYAAMLTPGGPWAAAAVAAATGALEKKLGIDQESWGDVLHGRTVEKTPTSWKDAGLAGLKKGAMAYGARKLGDAAREGWGGPARQIQGGAPGEAGKVLQAGPGWRGAVEGVKDMLPSAESIIKYGPFAAEALDQLFAGNAGGMGGTATEFPGNVPMPGGEIMPVSSGLSGQAQGYASLPGKQWGGELNEFEEPMNPFMAQLSNAVPNTMASMPTLPQGSNGNLPTNPFMDQLSGAVPNTMGSMNTEDMLYKGGGGTGDSYDPMLGVPQVGMFSTDEQKAAAEAQKRQDEANKKAENPYGEIPAEVLSGERDMTKEEVDKRAGLIEKEMDSQVKAAQALEKTNAEAAELAGEKEKTYPQQDKEPEADKDQVEEKYSYAKPDKPMNALATAGLHGSMGRRSNLGPPPWENQLKMPEGYRAGFDPEGQLGTMTGHNPFDMPTSGFGADADAFLERLKGGTPEAQSNAPQWQSAGVKGVQAVPGSAEGGPISAMDTVNGGLVPQDYPEQSGNVDTKLAVTMADAPMTPEDVGIDTVQLKEMIEWALLHPVEGEEMMQMLLSTFGEELVMSIAQDMQNPSTTQNDKNDRLVELETRKRLAEGEPVIPQAMLAGGEVVYSRSARELLDKILAPHGTDSVKIQEELREGTVPEALMPLLQRGKNAT